MDVMVAAEATVTVAMEVATVTEAKAEAAKVVVGNE